jgi:CubicO group peptidase (beta-lactamase class C family)
MGRSLGKVQDRFNPRIRPYAVEGVSQRNFAAEVSPADCGLKKKDVDRIWRALENLYRTRLYPALTLCVRHKGQIIVEGAIGHERGNAPSDSESAEKVLAHPKSLISLFSASKAITAMVAHLLDERHLIHINDPVAEYIPEFAAQGKERITIRHILGHRAGIPSLPGGKAELELLANWDELLARICADKPTTAAGRRAAYHTFTGGFVIGEIVRRVTGKTIREFLRDEILSPIGIEHLNYGISREDISRVAQNAATGPPPPPLLGGVLARALGVNIRRAATLANDPRFLEAIIPSANVIGTAEEACRFMELLLRGGELNGARIFDPRTIKRATAEQSHLEFDLSLGVPLRYGAGFILGNRLWPFYGKNAPRAFGHLGFTNCIIYADPDRDLSVALLSTGKPFIHAGLPRVIALVRAIGAAV